MTSRSGRAEDLSCFVGESVTAVEPTRDSAERVKVRVGRRVVATLRPIDVAELGLETGLLLDAATLDAIRERAAFVAAMDVTLRLMRRKALSKAEVCAKLADRGFADGVIARVVDRLEELGLVDDEAFAREALRQTTRSAPAGERLMRDVLERHGVEPEIARDAVAARQESLPDEETQMRALIESRLGSLKSLPAATQARRLLGLLARRGFEAEAAEQVVREILGLED